MTEARTGMFNYLKSLVPTWPDYVVKDLIYANLAKRTEGSSINYKLYALLYSLGLSENTQWSLVKMRFTMDMWETDTKNRLIMRAGGKKNPWGVPNDASRHATQASLAQQQGGVRTEPVIMIKSNDGWKLIEGWHRTIQHFAIYPDGYIGPAWVANRVHPE